MPPVKPFSDGATRCVGDHVRPKSRDADSTTGDSRKLPAASKVNWVHVTYTVPETGSAAIHSLSLKIDVGVGVPAAVTPSRCRIAGAPKVRPPSWDTDTA